MTNHSLSFGDRVATDVRDRQSVLVLGLDPRLDELPGFAREEANAEGLSGHAWAARAAGAACSAWLEGAADEIVGVKPQVAFFEAMGSAGLQELERLSLEIRGRGLILVQDAKRGDIGSTASAYARAWLPHGEDSTRLCGDAVTVNPYLGRDSLAPFVQACDTGGGGIFVLCRTSNPGGQDLQDRVLAQDGTVGGIPVYMAVASWLAEAAASRVGSSGWSPIGAVIGATHPELLTQLRRAMPHNLFLLPGVGAQGANPSALAPAFGTCRDGALVPVSRGLMRAWQSSDGRVAGSREQVCSSTRKAASELRVILERARAS